VPRRRQPRMRFPAEETLQARLTYGGEIAENAPACLDQNSDGPNLAGSVHSRTGARASCPHPFTMWLLSIAALVASLTACWRAPEPAVTTLLDRLREESSPSSWKVLAVADRADNLAKQGQGVALRGDNVVQTSSQSVIRLDAFTEEPGLLLVTVAYKREWAAGTELELRLTAGGRSIGSYREPLGTNLVTFEADCSAAGLLSLELVHRVNAGTVIPIARVVVGVVPDCRTGEAVHLPKSVVEWLARTGWDAGRELPVSPRFPISLDGCTRDCVVLAASDTVEIPLPPDAGGSRLRFWLMDLGQPPGRRPLVRLDAIGRSTTKVLGHWTVEQKHKWRQIDIQPGTIPPHTGTVRFTLTGSDPFVAVAEPMLLAGKKPRKRKWNLLLIDLDTVRADRLGCYGYRERPTSARLDSFLVAKGFCLFDRTVAPSSWTLASTANFLSSRYLHDGLQPNAAISSEPTMLAEVMRDNGYYCVGFTAGGLLRTTGFERGFHEYHWGGGNGQAEQSFPQAKAWLRQPAEPFFLFLHTYEAHLPYTRTTFCRDLPRGRLRDPSRWGNFLPEGINTHSALSREESLYVEALYDGGVRHACDAVADVFSVMDSLGLWDRTVVVVLSDHGEEFWEHFRVFATHCHSLYRELLDVPFMLYSPRSKGFCRVAERVSLVDLLPTVADVLRLRWNRQADGTSLVPLMQGGEVTRTIPIMACMSHNAHGKALCVLDGDVKYMEAMYRERHRKNGGWTRVGAMGQEMYRLDSDPDEQRNIAGARPALADSMAEKLASSLQMVHAPVRSERANGDVALRHDLKQQLRALGYISPN
jgi:arylsulfatase A-like enzyme